MGNTLIMHFAKSLVLQKAFAWDMLTKIILADLLKIFFKKVSYTFIHPGIYSRME